MSNGTDWSSVASLCGFQYQYPLTANVPRFRLYYRPYLLEQPLFLQRENTSPICSPSWGQTREMSVSDFVILRPVNQYSYIKWSDPVNQYAISSGQPQSTSTAISSGQPQSTSTAISNGQPQSTSTAISSGQPQSTSTAILSGQPPRRLLLPSRQSLSVCVGYFHFYVCVLYLHVRHGVFSLTRWRHTQKWCSFLCFCTSSFSCCFTVSHSWLHVQLPNI